jgi:sentrin-specific protease 7
VVATLRDYLSCEFKVKYPDLPPRPFTKNNMIGNALKVPQQQNFTDCGLFLLQYVEEFFKNPIADFRVPILNKALLTWFDLDLVTRKREDLSNLIKELMIKQNVKDVELPKLEFPTLDGKIIEPPTDALGNSNVEDAFESEAAGDEDYEPTEEEIKEPEGPSPLKKGRVYVQSKKRSLDNASDNGNAESPAKTNKRNKTT